MGRVVPWSGQVSGLVAFAVCTGHFVDGAQGFKRERGMTASSASETGAKRAKTLASGAFNHRSAHINDDRWGGGLIKVVGQVIAELLLCPSCGT
jgi:hypothetical protein